MWKDRYLFSIFLSWDTLQLSICLLFFLYCYFTLYIVVLTLKIDHYLVFISMKWSYLILSNVRFIYMLCCMCIVLTHWNNSVGRHVVSLGYIILIPRQPVVALTPLYCMLRRKTANTNCSFWFDLTGVLWHQRRVC